MDSVTLKPADWNLMDALCSQSTGNCQHLYLVFRKCDTYDSAPFIDPLFSQTPLGHIIPVLHTERIQMCSSLPVTIWYHDITQTQLV